MKATLIKRLATTALLGLLAISPLSAQTPASLEANTNKPAVSSGGAEILWSPSETIQKQKLENDKELELRRLENQKDLDRTRMDNEKQVAINRTDKHWQIIHDLAWNSWVLFAISIFFFGYLRDKRRHDTIRLMIEKGTAITPEILDGLRKKPRLGAKSYDPQGYLCWGVTEVLVAIALMISFPHGGGRIAGWIVLAVGIANLILWAIDRANSNGSQSK